MNTVTAPTQSPSQTASRSAESVRATGGATLTEVPSTGAANAGAAYANTGAAYEYDIANVTVRIAGSEDARALAELARRAGSERPAGALMVADAGDRLLAAVSMASGQVLSDPTAAGAEAQAVVRYTLARLVRRNRGPRPIAA